MRETERKFVVEGSKFIQSALDSGVALEAIYYEHSDDEFAASVLSNATKKGYRSYQLAGGTLNRIADTVTPQSVVAIASYIDVPMAELPLGSLIVVMAGVRDPGNAGTIIRSALASGASAVIFCDDCVDLYNPKTVRSSAGSLFAIPIAVADSFVEVADFLSKNGYLVVGTSSYADKSCWDLDLSGQVAIVVGNEGSGLDETTNLMLDMALRIPIDVNAESLNVGVAASILMFEAARQRAIKSA